MLKYLLVENAQNELSEKIQIILAKRLRKHFKLI